MVKASDYIAEFLKAQGVSHVFEMSGGMIVHMLDSIQRCTDITITSMHHEQAAAFAADAMGRLGKAPGVALATSGPGATNLLTGIGSCYFDSSPAIFITGQVNRHEMKKKLKVRQLGFQETDIVSMVRPITKAAFQVMEVDELPSILERAFQLAQEGRPGPVLIDIPMDIQRSEINADVLPLISKSKNPLNADSLGLCAELLAALQNSERPLVLLGGGVSASRTEAVCRDMLETLNIPAVHSLMAIDVLPMGHPSRVGMIGTYGNRWANLVLGRADMLIVVGSRLDVRQTGADTVSFRGGRTIFHVDCEPAETNNRVKGCREIILDLEAFFRAITSMAEGQAFEGRTAWRKEIDALREQHPDTRELIDIKGINPNGFMHRLSSTSSAAHVYVVDVGQHQMWAAQSLEIRPGQRFITSGGMGAMGFALPAAIGASLSGETPEPVVVIAGDGGFQTNIQELQTVARNGLPIKIVVINNRCHGMVRQFQQSYMESRYQSTLWGYSAPDFAKVSEAYGISARTVISEDELDDALAWFWESPKEPVLLQVMVDTYVNVYPKVAFGQPITVMEP